MHAADPQRRDQSVFRFPNSFLNLNRADQQKTDQAYDAEPKAKAFVTAVPRIPSQATKQYAANYRQPEKQDTGHIFTLHDVLSMGIPQCRAP